MAIYFYSTIDKYSEFSNFSIADPNKVC